MRHLKKWDSLNEGLNDKYYLKHDFNDFTGSIPFDESEIRKIKRIFGENWIFSFGDNLTWLLVWSRSTIDKDSEPTVYIRPLDDEYYLVRVGVEKFKCDQLDGLKKLLMDKGVI